MTETAKNGGPPNDSLYASVALDDGPASLNDRLVAEVMVGSLEGVQKALADGADLNASSTGGNMALHAAVGTIDRRRMIPFLIEQGFDVNAVNSFGETALHIAVKESIFVNVQTLLENGADPTIENNKNLTALDYVLISLGFGDKLMKEVTQKLIEVLREVDPEDEKKLQTLFLLFAVLHADTTRKPAPAQTARRPKAGSGL
jgi:ankyrin repeat protein